MQMSQQQTIADDGHPADRAGKTAASSLGQYLTFLLDGEEYGVDILKVQEIKGWEGATRIPNTQDFVRGAINLRGTIVPVVDLRTRFGLTFRQYGATTVVIVVKVDNRERARTVGIVVDAVSDVYDVAGECLQTPPTIGAGVSREYVQWLATVDDKMVILLDVDRLIIQGVLEDPLPTRIRAC